MPRTELRAGPIDYVDTGGDGPVLVFGHGLPMNESQWRKVLPLLDGYRCILPTLPLGAHIHPMKPDADLTLRGMAHMVGDFIEALDLRDVTLVLNDWGGGQFVISEGRADRVGRMVLVACEAFDNFPPAGAARLLPLVCKVPGGLWLFAQSMRLGVVQKEKHGYGAMSLRGIPGPVVDDWFGPLRRNAAIRRDFAKYVTSVPDRSVLLEWSKRLASFDRPVLVVWAKQDKLMQAAHGRRLADLFPNSRLVEVDDSATLVPEDQPEELARLIREFVGGA